MVLRVVGLVLIICAALMFFSGNLSFRSETETSSDGYQIHHTIVFSQSAIIPGVVGVYPVCVEFVYPGQESLIHKRSNHAMERTADRRALHF
jgi:hypothetical protein